MESTLTNPGFAVGKKGREVMRREARGIFFLMMKDKLLGGMMLSKN